MTEPLTRPPRNRLRWQPRQVIVLALVWVVLWGQVNLVTVVGGVLMGILVTVLFPLPSIGWAGRPHPWALLVLLGHLVKDLAVASFRLAVFAFGRDMPSPGIVRVDLKADSDLYQVNTAELVSVVPGTIVVDARQRSRILYLHVFDMPKDSTRDEVVADTLALEKRVVRALGSRAEFEALDREVPHDEPEFREVT
ncbi:Na+/H+ antiporter subunit E [Propioniciclava sp. MC1683]|uniref:Na+/H+ antiporter subunit E n=1 Tax=Propioniciclava sp. MC1683 TaxID=2760309 RepID=UPI001603870E|nr:Na+/H+ antiporter subunit E [Propioniciclava sp. MC1683]MBB1501015.1 Na+/H+ antiporter subunit E [Propioniciclava sp. MC1683]